MSCRPQVAEDTPVYTSGPQGCIGAGSSTTAGAISPAVTNDEAARHERSLHRSGKLAILDMMKSAVVASSPDVMGGAPVFAGTRVPIENLLDYLEGGESIEDFLEGFPSVSREQVIAFLEETKARVLAEVG